MLSWVRFPPPLPNSFDMAFINVPVLFIEENSEQQENLGLSPKTTAGEIVINTKLLCAYNEMDNKNTMLRLANGDCVEVNMRKVDFGRILGTVESIIELPKIGAN